MSSKYKKINRALEIKKQIDAVAPLYRELDSIIEYLVKNKVKSRKIKVIDNYSDKNTQFKVAFFKRYDIAIIKQKENK